MAKNEEVEAVRANLNKFRNLAKDVTLKILNTI